MIAFSAYRHRHALMLGIMHITIFNKGLTPKTQKIVGYIVFNRIRKMHVNSFSTIKPKSFVNAFKSLYAINNKMIFSFFISYIFSCNEELNNFFFIVPTINLKTILLKLSALTWPRLKHFLNTNIMLFSEISSFLMQKSAKFA